MWRPTQGPVPGGSFQVMQLPGFRPSRWSQRAACWQISYGVWPYESFLEASSAACFSGLSEDYCKLINLILNPFLLQIARLVPIIASGPCLKWVGNLKPIYTDET